MLRHRCSVKLKCVWRPATILNKRLYNLEWDCKTVMRLYTLGCIKNLQRNLQKGFVEFFKDFKISSILQLYKIVKSCGPLKLMAFVQQKLYEFHYSTRD